METTSAPKSNKLTLSLLSFFVIAILFMCFGYYFITQNTPNVVKSRAQSMVVLQFPANVYGENLDMSQILPSSTHYIKNSSGQDLIDIAAGLGVNTVRITNAVKSTNNNKDSLYTKKEWDIVLNKLAQKNIKAVILIETNSNNPDLYTEDIKPAYLNLVKEYINSKVFSNPDVIGVDIKNEPLLNSANIQMLSKASSLIRTAYPNLPQTVGWWKTDTGQKDSNGNEIYAWDNYSAGYELEPFIDYYSVHMYDLDSTTLGVIGINPDLKTKLFLYQVESELRTNKKILIEEFGEPNGSAVSDDNSIGSPELQEQIYAGVFKALKEMKSKQIMGAMAFDMYSRDKHPDAWAITNSNGDYLYPAALILKDFATNNGVPIPGVQTSIDLSSKSYLYNNTNNNSSQNVNVGDRVGFELKLDPSQTYSLQSNQNFTNLESLHFDQDHNYYVTLLKITNKGVNQIKIISGNKTVFLIIINAN